MDKSTDPDLRIIRLAVDEPDYEVLEPLPDVFLHFGKPRVRSAMRVLDDLNTRINDLFWQVESVERAIWHAEPGFPVLREVRESLRRALAGWEGDVLPGFDAAHLALVRYGSTPAANR